MTISQDFPPEMRPVAKIFEEFHSWDYYTVMCDILDMMIFAWRGQHQSQEDHDSLMAMRDSAVKKYNAKDKEKLNRLFYAILQVFREQIDKGAKWYDSFGVIFESLKGHGSCASMGQFFTPACVCDLMAQITIEELTWEESHHLRVIDPASGSGRTLLAAHAIQPYSMKFGTDIDYVCAKMTAVNLMLHGAKSEVVCMNALFPENWRFGYIINSRPWNPGIHVLKPENSYIWQSYEQWKVEATAMKADDIERKRQEKGELFSTEIILPSKKTTKRLPVIVQSEPMIDPNEQLTLFC